MVLLVAFSTIDASALSNVGRLVCVTYTS
jgi:hypothetical protein